VKGEDRRTARVDRDDDERVVSSHDDDVDVGALVVPAPEPEVRAVSCPRVETLSEASLRTHVKAADWKVTGQMVYCAGNMVNFQCRGGAGQGVTAKRKNERGSAVILRFQTDGKATDYVRTEAKRGKTSRTLAHAGRVVLRIEMPEDDAARLARRVCR